MVELGEPLEGAAFDSAVAPLPAAERARIGRYRFADDRMRALLAALLVRTLAARHAGIAAADVEIVRGELDRPALAWPAGWPGDVNASHSGRWVACGACGRGRIGVDVEMVRAVDPGLARRVFSPSERRYLAAGGDERFFELWTLKEALVKATGRGLQTPLDSFGFDPDALERGRPVLAPGADVGGPWRFARWRIDADHFVAVCTDGPLPDAPRVIARAAVLAALGAP
ncbi:MAG TPA: 4'-phosphopantetheinyl transferase superfamily protein [Actinomycetota bacterium]|nr:4'-phosphopantetheinyl transferase superfamily protein [Actinomycetota bacterium]